jgi:hypothetical protein
MPTIMTLLPLRSARGVFLRMQINRGALNVHTLSMDDILSAGVPWVLEHMETAGAARNKNGAITDPNYTCTPEARRLARHLAKLLRYFMPELTHEERTALMTAEGKPQDELNRLVAARLMRRELDDAQMYATLAQGSCKERFPLVTTYKHLVATLEAADAGRIGCFMHDLLRDGVDRKAVVARANRHVAWCIQNIHDLGDEKTDNIVTLPQREDAVSNA